MAQCINTYCLHGQNDDSLFCEQCGCSTVVDDRFLVTKLMSKVSLVSPTQTQVFEAIDLESEQEVILRVVHSDNPLYVEPLKHTVVALSQAHSKSVHPGLMQLAEQDYYLTLQIRSGEPISHCMVAKKVDGINLKAWLDRYGAISESLATNWLKQLLTAVDALHKCNFLHRDIKPENIMVTGDLQLVVVDFDAIFPLTAGLNKSPAIGTPIYMAPEQSAGEPRPSSDLYSVGRLMTELLTGKDPGEVSRTSTGAVDWRQESKGLSQSLTLLIDRLANSNTLYRPTDADSALSYLAESEAISAMRNRWRWLDNAVTKTAVVLLGISAFISIGAISFSQIPSESDRLLAEGNQMILAGETEQGIALIERGVTLNPDSAELRNSLALAQSFLGDPVSAIENFEKALELSPENPYALYNLANVYEGLDMERAISYYIASAEIDSPIRSGALNGLARAYLLTDRPQEAQEILSGLVDRASSETSSTAKMAIFKNAAWANFQLGNFDQARTQIDLAIDADPTQPDPYCLSALLQQQSGEDDYDDKTTCLLLRMVIDKPELRLWKSQLFLSDDR